MSLKVYTGIKFKSKDINEILSQLNSIKEQSVKNVIDYYIQKPKKIHAFILSKNFDNIFRDNVANCITNQNFGQEVMDTFVNTFITSMAKTYVSYDDIYANFIVHIIPYKGSYYGYYTCGDIGKNEELLCQFTDEFYFQNQTDKPDNITTKEWNKRSKIWNDIFDHEDKFIGLQYKIIDHNTINYWDIEEIFKSFVRKYRIGYFIQFNCKPNIKISNSISQNVDILIKYTDKFKNQHPEFKITRHDIFKNSDGTTNVTLAVYIYPHEEDIDDIIQKITNIPEVITTEEEMYTNKKQIFYEIK